MKPRLGLHAVAILAILAIVALSTLVLVKPELIGGSAHATVLAIGSIPALGHH
ncbi:hypothetical protein [Massilia timonae]|uniref:Uncharacterized protein n=1 Tax=Massilia timonae CCUG 45783 TaxID=883126 RepID=K9D988_9BURK|nr:hypothetical protein [Massilia timonae]EKU79806.1 hypothetical protein HMPREF9710_05002 [Massilia timonae CCUG 45783]